MAERITIPFEGKRIDLVVDSAGGENFNDLLEIVKPGGRMVILGATAGNPSSLNLRRIFWKQIRIQGSTMGNHQDFENMLNLSLTGRSDQLLIQCLNFINISKLIDGWSKLNNSGRLCCVMILNDLKIGQTFYCCSDLDLAFLQYEKI